MKVLILGGYGTFGGRLAHLLADESRLTLVIAGRSLEKARTFCAALGGASNAVPAAFDRDGDVDEQLRILAPDVVVDASGPFQMYGDPYRLLRAVIARGINYLDLADGSDFVDGVSRFDGQARARGIFALAGVSSFPVLTAAIVRRLGRDMDEVVSVMGGIAPSPYAGVGLNVIRAIASYAGKTISVGKDAQCIALADTLRFTVAPPGYVPLAPTLFSLVDVPDLKALPELWPSLRRVWIGAGPVPEILHRALNLLARVVRSGLIRSAEPLAPLMHRAINIVRFGEHRGGMFVSARGRKDGADIERSWHMIAEGDDGPLIPSMACEAIIRKCLDDTVPATGARAATRDLELEDYEALFARRRIVTGVREMMPAGMPLYRKLLGEAWWRLPRPVQDLHDIEGALVWSGMAVVERGRSLVARIVAAVFGFPPAGTDIPVTVSFQRDGERELWERDFGGRKFRSVIEQGRGRFEWLQCERFGPLAFGLAVVVTDGHLTLVPRRWSAFGIPMPAFLLPRGNTYEHGAEERFNFHVEITLPVAGLIVRYRGWLLPQPKS
jgi:hypothetical protein